LVLGLLALYAPTPSLLFAFGSSLCGAAFLLVPALWYSPAGALLPIGIRIAVVCAFFGGLLMLWLAARTERSKSIQGTSSLAPLLAAGAIALASVAPFFKFTNALEMNEAARVRPAAGAVLIGVSALLLTTKRVSFRVLAFLLAIIAISPVVLATDGFRHRFGKDPLLADHVMLDWREPPHVALATWHIRDQLQTLDLSPAGTALIGAFHRTDSWCSARYHRAAIPGNQVALHHRRFMLSGSSGSRDGFEVREYHTAAPLGEGEPKWRLPLPSLQGMTLDVDPDAGTGASVRHSELRPRSSAVSWDRIALTRRPRAPNPWRTTGGRGRLSRRKRSHCPEGRAAS
jgi:hypothetical protein